jgi:hypothetical protein
MSRTVSLIRAMRRKYAGLSATAAPGIPKLYNVNMPQAPSLSQPQAPAAPVAARGQAHVMGTGIPQTGLPPSKVNAAPLPGAPGGVASNPIERHGGLGPAGTVDGNHAAGISKGFKIG